MSKLEKTPGSRSARRRGEAGGIVPTIVWPNDALLSSKTRLQIAEMMSRRPRTLRELARSTRLSVPGVLRHLEAMSEAGFVHEQRLSTRSFPARKLYSLKGVRVMDFSVGDLSVFKVSAEKPAKSRNPSNLDSVSMEILVERRGIKEKARRLARAIDDLGENEDALVRGIGEMDLTEEERLILEVMLTEETLDDGVRILSRFYGIEDRRSIDKALVKAKRNVGK